MSNQELLQIYSAYLPYGVKCWVKDYTEIGKQPINNAYTLNAVYSDGSCVFYDLVESSQGFKEVKLILRPLSDLTKEDYKEELLTYYEGLGISIKHMSYYDSGNNDPSDFTILVTYKMLDDVFTDCLINRSSISESPYHFVKWLHQNHFDTDGLIEKGLAININKLK